MSTNAEQRVSVKLQCPNPLFEGWLLEWRDEAREKNLKTQHTYSLALNSLRKYPLPLESGKDCKILKGFGNKLCQMLDDYLKQHLNSKSSKKQQVDEKVQDNPETIRNKLSKVMKQNNEKNMGTITSYNYIPSYKSGPYVILITLYKSTLKDGNDSSMYKKDIIKEAQPLCDSSFIKPQPGFYYNAWSSIKILLEKNLVMKKGNPVKFSLTKEGILLGQKLYTQMNCSDEIAPSKSQVVVPNDNQTCVIDVNLNLPFQSPITAVSSELKNICGNHLGKERSADLSEFFGENAKEHQDVFLLPYSFDVILYVDNKETCGANSNARDDPIIAELKTLDVYYEVKHLKVGDYSWICRDKSTGVELVAPYIIERKRMDDLAASIKDGRFYEQKFRLKQCGLQNVVYVIESYSKKDEHLGMPLASLQQAAVNTLIQDGFCVKFVDGIRGVAEYLSCMTNLIRRNYENKTLVSSPKEGLSDISITDDLLHLMSFEEFNKFSSKAKNFTVKDMFIKHLLQMKGISIDKAFCIVEQFSTPQVLRTSLGEIGSKGVKMIANLKYGKLGKKIGPTLANTIHQFYSTESF